MFGGNPADRSETVACPNCGSPDAVLPPGKMEVGGPRPHGHLTRYCVSCGDHFHRDEGDEQA